MVLQPPYSSLVFSRFDDNDNDNDSAGLGASLAMCLCIYAVNAGCV